MDVDALCSLLRYRYHWLPEEWWRLYIDARNYGGAKTCTIELAPLNNEALINDVGFHSPDHYWPVHLMYGDNSRENLNLNLGGPSNYLNSWISSAHENGNLVFLSADSVCMDSILGGGLIATSQDKFNAYDYETHETRGEVGTNGFRSELKRRICREHPESLLPSLPTNHLVLCSNHMMSRVTEQLVVQTVLSVLDDEKRKVITPAQKEAKLQHFVENINSRGVRSGQFKIRFEGATLEPITLNTTHAETISSPPELLGSQYCHILDNVVSDRLFPNPLSGHLQQALSLGSSNVTYLDLEKHIWDVNWRMHLICRWDPDPRLHQTVNPNTQLLFGLKDEEIEEYGRLADIFHGLMLFRYKAVRLTPYMIKRVDIVPILLKELPWHGLMRGSTEGGEQSHYRDQVWFYGNSSRGGGWTKADPVLNVFLLMYRRLREQMRSRPQDIQDKFEAYVASQVSASQETTPGEASNSQFVNDAVPPQPDHCGTGVEVLSKKHKRGDRISVKGHPGNFLQYTPSGSGGNVILRGNNTRPKRIPLNEIVSIQKLPFDGEYFMIAGKFVINSS